MLPLPEILYLRHGRSIENELGKDVKNWVDPAKIVLTREGYTEARTSGLFLADYCQHQGYEKIGLLQSPFLRAMHTGDRVAESLGIYDLEHVLGVSQALTETALQPQDPTGCRPPPEPEEGFLNRYLADGSVSDLRKRLSQITSDAAEMARQYEVRVVALISHQFTSRLHMVSEGLGLGLEQVDHLRPFGNCHIWRLAGNKLEALNPDPELIATREKGIINPVDYQKVRRKPMSPLKMKM